MPSAPADGTSLSGPANTRVSRPSGGGGGAWEKNQIMRVNKKPTGGDKSHKIGNFAGLYNFHGPETLAGTEYHRILLVLESRSETENVLV
jgi:hypothetical protein